MRTLAALSLLLLACGGRIADEGPSCPPPSVCSEPGWGPKSRGAVECADGQIAYVCCDYSEDEIARLRELGDVPASRCVVQQ